MTRAESEDRCSPLRRGMVLAAGLGTRMRPLTDRIPKPMVTVAGRSLIDRTLDRFADGGVETCVVNLHHLGDRLRAHLAGRQSPRLTFSDESSLLLETGGGVRKALGTLGPGPFFVANSDVLWVDGPAPALSRLAAAWEDGRMDALLLLVRCDAAHGYDGPGDFFLHRPDPPAGGGAGPLERRGDRPSAPFLFGGVQILHPRLFEGGPDGRFSLNVLYDRANAAGRLFGLVHDGAWYHVGTADSILSTERLLAERPQGMQGT